MSARHKLPNRRSHEVATFSHGGIAYSCGVGRYPDNTIGEIFIDPTVKSGSAVQAEPMTARLSRAAPFSSAVPLETICHSIVRDEAGQAVGPLGALLDLLAEGEVS